MASSSLLLSSESGACTLTTCIQALLVRASAGAPSRFDRVGFQSLRRYKRVCSHWFEPHRPEKVLPPAPLPLSVPHSFLPHPFDASAQPRTRRQRQLLVIRQKD